MASPNTVEGWLTLTRQHQDSAEMLSDDKSAAAQGYFHAGLAVECALKAYIMRRQRFNTWPSRQARPDLWTHDLRALREIAQIPLIAAAPVAAAWHIVLQWDRNQGYDPARMPRKVAKSMVEAAFGKNGVVTWIRQSLT
jgi:hypothetical protein